MSWLESSRVRGVGKVEKEKIQIKLLPRGAATGYRYEHGTEPIRTRHLVIVNDGCDKWLEDVTAGMMWFVEERVVQSGQALFVLLEASPLLSTKPVLLSPLPHVEPGEGHLSQYVDLLLPDVNLIQKSGQNTTPYYGATG